MKKKVLVLATTFPRWKDDSVPNFIYELTKELSQKYEPHVLTPHSKGSKYLERMDGIVVHRFPYFISKYENLSTGISILNALQKNKFNYLLVPFFTLSGIISFVILNIKFRFKIVHNHWLVPFAPFTSLFKNIFKYKLIITSHGGDILGFESSKVLNYLFKYCISRANSYTVVSSEMAKVASRFISASDQSKLKIISMGIPYKEFSSVKTNFSKNNFTAVFIGRLSEMKGTKYLLEAISILQDRNRRIKCKIIGSGPEEKSLKELSKKLQITNLIDFTGFIPHAKLPNELEGSSVFIGPSITTKSGYKEGFGLVFVEAMAAGIPVIATRSGGITDTVKHLKTGLLVEEKDPEGIANFVEKIIDDSELREKIVNGGREMAKQYSWQSIANKYSDLYEQ